MSTSEDSPEAVGEDEDLTWKAKRTSGCGCDYIQLTPQCWLSTIGKYGCSEQVYRNVGVLFPLTIPNSEKISNNPKFTNYELALRQDLDAGKSKWSGNCFADFLIYLVNSNPCLAIVFRHPLSSLRWDFRIIVGALHFLLFFVVYIMKEHLENDVDGSFGSLVVQKLNIALVVISAMAQKLIIATLVKCRLAQSWEGSFRKICKTFAHFIVYIYLLFVIVPVVYALCHVHNGTFPAVLFAFIWSNVTSFGRATVCFTIENVTCLKRAYATLWCSCCCELRRSKVNWKHFQIWCDMGKPDMLDHENVLTLQLDACRRLLKLRQTTQDDVLIGRGIDNTYSSFPSTDVGSLPSLGISADSQGKYWDCHVVKNKEELDGAYL